MSWVAAGVASAGLTLAAVKWVGGNSKEKKAKKAREKLAQPFYNIQDEYYQNANIAGGLAQGGLPAATKDYYTNQSEKGLSAGVQGILASGGNPNDISKIFQTYDDSIGKISAVDAEQHINNIKYYMGVNKDLAGQKTIQWAINKQQPYLNTLKELSAAQKAGEATKNEAYGDALSAISSFGTSQAGGGGFGGKGGKGGGGWSVQKGMDNYNNRNFNNYGTSGGGSSTFSKMFNGVGGGSSDNGGETNYSAAPDPFGSTDLPTGGTSNGNNDQLYQEFLQYLNTRGKR